jgi:hypothetical protein
MDVLKCILEIYPDWMGTVWGNSIEDIRPHELETRPIPTQEELRAAWERVLIKQEEAEKQKAIEKQWQDCVNHLAENDLKCVRALREYVLGLPGAASALGIYEVVASNTRLQMQGLKFVKID